MRTQEGETPKDAHWTLLKIDSSGEPSQVRAQHDDLPLAVLLIIKTFFVPKILKRKLLYFRGSCNEKVSEIVRIYNGSS